jgi:hypothetical protein
MGAGASVGVVPPQGVDRDGFKQLAPDHFSDALFNELRGKDGRISASQLQSFANQATDVFLTHDWGVDELGRNNHERVKVMNRHLKAAGLRTWFDEEAMHGNIREQMQKGIDYASCVVVFITERYIDKVGGKGDSGEMDNCRFEFNHIAGSKPPSRIITVVMEPRCRNQKEWYGMIKSTLHSQLYIDWTSDDEGRAESAAAEVMKMFRLQVPLAVSERMAALLPSGHASVSTDGNSIHRVAQDAVAVSNDVAPRVSMISPLKASRLDLKDLNQKQSEILVSSILGEDVSSHFSHPVSGAILASIDSAEEVQALFKTEFVLGPLRAKAVFNSVADLKTGGVDDAFLQKCKLYEGMCMLVSYYCTLVGVFGNETSHVHCIVLYYRCRHRHHRTALYRRGHDADRNQLDKAE